MTEIDWRWEWVELCDYDYIVSDSYKQTATPSSSEIAYTLYWVCIKIIFLPPTICLMHCFYRQLFVFIVNCIECMPCDIMLNNYNCIIAWQAVVSIQSDNTVSPHYLQTILQTDNKKYWYITYYTITILYLHNQPYLKICSSVWFIYGLNLCIPTINL